jgi:hypothetical protein
MQQAVNATKEVSFVAERKVIASYLADYGERPYFYNNEDTALFDNTMRKLGLNKELLSYNPELLYSIIPNFRVASLPESPYDHDKYGFMRFGVTQFALRPHINNIRSCLTFSMGYAGGGQLGYITNPAWACIGIFKDNADTEVKLDTRTPVTLTMPNMVASCNICYGFLDDGRPAIMLGVKSGETNLQAYRKFIYHCYGVLNRVPVTYTDPFGLLKATTTTFNSIPIREQLIVKEGGFKLSRGTDMPQSVYNGDMVAERQQVVIIEPDHVATKPVFKSKLRQKIDLTGFNNPQYKAPISSVFGKV